MVVTRCKKNNKVIKVMNILFFIPFLYLIKTRLKTKPKIISWIIIYIIPQVILFFLLNLNNIENSLIIFLLSIALVYNLYETGYIYNDTETIKKEKKPTLRLTNSNLNFYQKNKLTIYIWRFTSSITITFLIATLSPYNDNLIYVMFFWLIIPIFGIYNSIRNNFNLPLHFLLVTVRYSAPLFFILRQEYIIIVFVISYSLLNLIERMREKRFNLTLINESSFFAKTNTLRVCYYVFILLSISTLNIFKIELPYNKELMVVIVFYLIYRTLILLLKLK